MTVLALLALALVAQDRGTPPARATPDAIPSGATIQRGLILATEAATPGYTLIAPLRSTTTFLLDAKGLVVHTWPSVFPPGNSVQLLDDGSILRACRVESSSFRGGGMGGRLQRIAWDGKVTWDHELSDSQRVQHHDARALPNGNVLALVWEVWPQAEVIAAGRDPEHAPFAGLWSDAILELAPHGADGAQVVWEWRVRDHLVQDFDAQQANHADIAARPERVDVNADHRRELPLTEEQRKRREETEARMRATGYAGDAPKDEAKDAAPRRDRPPGAEGDWLHTNSVHWLASHDLIAISVRSLDEVWVIDHGTTTAEARGSTGGKRKRGGDLLYRWGNPQRHGGGGAAQRRLFRQHDASWIGAEEGGLAMLVFNNGEGRPGGERSTVDEILLPFDAERGFAPIAPGSAAAPASARWTYPGPDRPTFYSSFLSSAQRLASGGTLVCSGVDGRVFEVDRAGAIVWEYRNEHGDASVGTGAGGGRGAPPGAAPRDGAGPDGAPRDAAPRDGPPRGGPPGGGGPRGGMDEKALFRATRIALDHPGLARLKQE